VTARFALLVAPSDPLLGSASARLEVLGWLRNQMARRGFQVAIVGSGGNPLADLEQTAGRIAPGDSVLVHVTGRLLPDDSVALSETTPLPLFALTDFLAARSPGYASLILDLVNGQQPGDQRDPVDLLSGATRSLGAAERGYSVLAGLRSWTQGADRIAFTRLAMPPLDDGGPPSTEALLSTMHDRAAAAGENGAGEQSFVLLRGAPDATIDGLVAQASQTGDWRRVVDLRLDRVGTLTAVGQRADELAGIARVLRLQLRDADGAVEVLEQARALDPKRASVLEALHATYEASGRAAPIDPAEYAKAFATHRRTGQTDAALLDAMLLEALGAAEPEHLATVERSRSVGPMQALKPLDEAAWNAMRASGFDEAVAALLGAVHDAAVTARLERLRASRRLPSLDPASRMGAESTVSAVRTLHWAARVLGIDCPDVYPGAEDSGEPVAHVPNARPSISLAPRALSGTTAKQLAFLAGRALTWYRREYRCMLYYSTFDDLRELVGAALEIGGVDGRFLDPQTKTQEMRRAVERHLDEDARAAIGEAAAIVGARGDEIRLDHWTRSAELTAARAGLLLCGELKTAMAGVQLQSPGPGRPSVERVTSDLVAFCASRAHAALRAQFLRLPS
jgi:hypothetical protein